MHKLLTGEPVTKDTKQFITLESGHLDLTPELIRNSIRGIEEMMKAAPTETQVGLETMHNFIDGVYTRTVFMKAGSLIAGKIHKKEHIVIIGKGSASVISEEMGAQMIQAPAIFISPPEVKRLLFIHEDMIWTTVHKNETNTRDLAILEEELILKDYSEGTL